MIALGASLARHPDASFLTPSSFDNPALASGGNRSIRAAISISTLDISAAHRVWK